MQLTLFSDYSLRTLLYLSAHGDRRVALAEIASAYGISQHHLVKVSQRLIEAELVVSTRGRGGGLRLARKPETINLGEVVRLTEPHLDLVECFDAIKNTCPINGACGLKGALMRARAAFLDELARYTLADLSPQPQRLIQIWQRQLAVQEA